MNCSKLGLIALTVSLVAFTACTETPLPAVTTAISLPPFPPKSPVKMPKIQLCTAKVDLSVQAQELTVPSAGWLKVCTPIRNSGGVAWSSNASQLALAVSNSIGGSASASGFGSLASSATTTKCATIPAPGLLRLGHSTAQFGECPLTMTVTSKLVFDPDILLDGNTANDDCLTANNTRKVTVDYMAACPW